ncbi:hypothetical protein Sjap_025803 [Stephania japonica]|uniref:GB1/RHD3-type G domain-containing protein n=1 Tax=Stephania japonica TaxID=461633 RepID=A0AAP0HHW0_9MAGN
MMSFFSRGSASKDHSNNDASPQSSSDQNPSPNSSPYTHSPSFSTGTGPGRPLRLVYCDERGKFVMDPEAVAMLQLVKGPIGVVSVCGRARQGKSFVLNQGTYSTQIFSLAVLLSSMFIYNQIGGIDEGAIDRLSLVTEMTKHIRIRASGGRSTASELGQFSPIFVWLLRDFYLDLVEDNQRITPRDYLELALRPTQGARKDIAAKNEIRESIRALFPDRECFTLVRPLNNENDLQRLDQISVNKLRPEFRSGLDALIKFVFERTRPKQVGSTVMTGPLLAGITQSFLDAINKGAVPTISSSWQSVEEAECRRAYDSAAEVYMSSFDRSKPPEETALREAHDVAVQKSIAAFNASAVGSGSVRQKYEKLVQTFFKKAFEDYKRNAFIEADLKCSNAIQSMEKKLRAACHAPDAKVDHVVKQVRKNEPSEQVLEGLLTEYEKVSHGSGKWQKLATFLQQSLEGPVLDVAKRQFDQLGSEKSSLALKCRSIEDRMNLLTKQLETSEMNNTEYRRRYENAINEKKTLADEYMSRINNLQSKCSSLEERISTSLKERDFARQESLEWKRKYDQISSRLKADEDKANLELSTLKSRTSAAEAMLAAAREQIKSAEEEASDWKRKFELASREAKAALEKAAVVQERTNKQIQLREDALRSEFSANLAGKEEEIKKKASKIEYAEKRLTTLSLELKAAEAKVKTYDVELSTLKFKISELDEKLESAKERAQSFEREAKMLEQEKIHIEEKYLSEFKRFEEIQDRCRSAEKEAKKATEMADKARAEGAAAQKEKSKFQQLAMEKSAHIERAERQIENLERMKADLLVEVERYRVSEMEAVSKVALLEGRVEEREKEIESLLESNNEQRTSTVQVLESLLETERAARAEANNRAEALSMQLQATQGKLDLLQQELTSVRLNETALGSKLKTVSHGKRTRQDNYDPAFESVQDMDVDRNDKVSQGRKRSKSTNSPLTAFKYTHTEDGGSVFKGGDDNSSQQTETDDYTKFTVAKLKQELTKHGFGAEFLQLKSPNKKDLLALYEKHVIKK